MKTNYGAAMVTLNINWYLYRSSIIYTKFKLHSLDNNQECQLLKHVSAEWKSLIKCWGNIYSHEGDKCLDGTTGVQRLERCGDDGGERTDVVSG